MTTSPTSLLEQAWRDPRRELLDALHNPACYPHWVTKVEHLETHISDVILTGQYAYKLKKPVDLGFADFSTLEKRQYFCHEELRLNARLAPELYLGVVTIAGDIANPRIGGEGPVLEYAVQMSQFDQRCLLERVLARGELSGAPVDELASILARFHAVVPRAPPSSVYGTAASVTGPTVQNFEQLRPLLDTATDLAALERLHTWTMTQHDRMGGLFDRRQRNGFVRECHGDLHLANIVMIDGKVRIFDCIEFNPALRWIDVMNEVAFLAMDFIQHRHPQLAYRMLDVYLQLTGDYAGLSVLRYYMVYRSLVRAKVIAMRAAQANLERGPRQSLRAKSRAHIGLAEQLTQATPPMLILLHGLSGSGKTTLSQGLLQTMGAIRLRSDVERKRLHGLEAMARSGSGLATGMYTSDAGEATYHRLAELAVEALQSGFSVFVDAAFLARSQRSRFVALAAEVNVAAVILHTRADPAVLRQRIVRRAAADSDASEAGLEVLAHQMRTGEPLSDEELAYTVIVDTEGLQQPEQAHDIDAIIQRLRQAAQGDSRPG